MSHMTTEYPYASRIQIRIYRRITIIMAQLQKGFSPVNEGLKPKHNLTGLQNVEVWFQPRTGRKTRPRPWKTTEESVAATKDGFHLRSKLERYVRSPARGINSNQVAKWIIRQELRMPAAECRWQQRRWWNSSECRAPAVSK